MTTHTTLPHGASLRVRILGRLKPTNYLLALCLFVFLAHFCASDLKGIWIDEGYRFAKANGGPFKNNLNERTPSDLSSVLKLAIPDVHQPLYYVQMNLLMRLSRSYSTVIQYTANTLIFLLSAVGIFCLARLFLPLEGQLVSLLLYAFNGQAMAFALQIREYCLILCLLVWNIYFFLRFLTLSAVEKKPLLATVVAAHLLTAILALYASFWSVFFFFPQAFLVLWQLLHGRRRGLLILASLFVAGLALIPWLLQGTRKLNMKVWDTTPLTAAYLGLKLQKGFEFVLTGNVVHHWLPTPFVLMFVVLALTFLSFLVWSLIRYAKIGLPHRYVLLACLSFFGFQLAYSVLKDPLAMSGRYFILYLPFTSLGAGIIFTEASKLFSARRRSVFEATALLFVLAIGLLQILQYYHDPDVDHRDDFRVIHNYLEPRVAPTDDVVVDSSVNARCLQFYSNRPERFRVGFGGYIPSMVSTPRSVWLVFNRPELKEALASLKGRLTINGYHLIKQQRVEKTLILHYATSR